MHRPIRSALALALAASALASRAAGAAAATADTGPDGGPVRVVFVPPSASPTWDRPLGGVAGDDPALAELSRYLRAQAAPHLAAGQTLEVTITDIDRAGQFEPRRGPAFDSVRVVRDVTPPRVDLAFRLVASDGQVIRSGTRELRDMNFLSRPLEAPVDPLRHEKRLLAGWIERDLR